MTTLRLTVTVGSVVDFFLDNPDKPHYGLEIVRAADIGSGTLYPILKRLVKAGWLTEQPEATNADFPGRTPRCWYTLTDDGRRDAPVFTGRVPSPKPHRRSDPGVTLDPWQQWYAPGRTVVELERFSRTGYFAEATTVTRVTKSQVHTATGRVFWRDGSMARVGYATARLRNSGHVPLLRLVPRDHVHAVAELGPPPPDYPPSVPPQKEIPDAPHTRQPSGRP